MAVKTAAILRWTGRGGLTDLERSVGYVLQENRLRPQIRKIGDSVVVEGPEPLAVAALLENMPGVAWIAAGFATLSFRETTRLAGSIARRYLRRGERFSVEAEGTAGIVASDVGGAVTSAILDSVKGTRVSVESPRVRFLASFDGSRGVVGVEIARGPGGVPTGAESVACLVSGGVHSSVVAWMSVLMGLRVRLVHAESGEGGLRAVARLYSELSHRVDPRSLGLEVLKGGSESRALATFVAKSKDPVFGGFHSSLGAAPGPLRGKVLAPLYLLPEERFKSEFEALRVKGHSSAADWKGWGRGKLSVRTFGGVVSDVSDVLDGLR